MPPAVSRIAIAIAFALAARGVASAQPPSPPPSAHPTPAAELGAICEEIKASEMPWYGEAPMRFLKDKLASFSGPPLEEARIRGPLGVELLKLGHPGEAIQVLEQGIALVDGANPGDEGRWGMVFFLGLAYLQLAEDENCIERHNEASCILPLRPEAVHSKPEAARKAAEAFLAVVGNQPQNIQAAWLFNLARMLSGDYPQGVPEGMRLPPSAFASEGDSPRFIDRAPALGVDVFDLAGGAVMEDLDGDGLLDLVTTTWDSCGPMKAFRNDGQGGFEEVTAAWGLADQLGGLNLVQTDYDNDGDADLLVLRGGWMFAQGRIRNSLLRNDLQTPARRFTDVTYEAGLAFPAYPTQAGVWADYDGDGDLDLFLGNEATAANEPYPSQLYRNDGDGTFTDVAAHAGVTNFRYAKSAAWGDYDGDGDPDLYVSNLGPNRLYRNEGDGTFTDVAPELGLTEPSDRSFGTWFFDFDNDGDLDLLVNDYSAPMTWVTASFYGLETPGGQPLLYRNDGPAPAGSGGRSWLFTEVSKEVGISRPSLPMGCNFGDFDNDGWLDFYLGTGDPRYEAVMPNVAYRNASGHFEEITFAAGLGHLQKGHGVAFGDLDNDGDQDLFHQLGGFYPGDGFSNALFENPGPARSWITLRLEGKKANRAGVGARIEVRGRRREGERSVLRSIHVVAGTGASFGGSSLQQEIGLGDAEAIEEVVIRWPGSGTVDRFRDVPLNRFYRAVEGAAELAPLTVPRLELGRSGPAHREHHPAGKTQPGSAP